MTTFGDGVPILAPLDPAPVLAPPAPAPVVALPVPGPAGGVDLDVDEHGKYILDGGGPADTNGA